MAQMITCPHCGHRVEEAAYCTNCGQALNDTTVQDPPKQPEARSAESPSAAEPAKSDTATGRGRFGRRLPRGGRSFHILPVPLTGNPRRYRWIVAIDALVVLLLLLGGNAGTAIVIATAIIPLLFVSYLYEIDLYEDESRLGLLSAGIWGGLVGLGIGAANAWLVGRFWIKHATLHVGAAGFGSRFADAAGLPPIWIFLVTGIALPVIALALLAVGASALRRFPSFRNEVMDGMTAGAATGGGFAIATTLVFFWPLITRSANPGLGVGEWTGMLIGLVVLRPIIVMAIVAIVCAGLWRLDLSHQTSEERLPIALGLGAIVVYSLGDLFVQPSGARAEFVWLLVVTILVWFAFRLMTSNALAQDRRALGRGNWLVCPHCRKLTPPGEYCVACGKPLSVLPTSEAAKQEAPEEPAVAATPAAPAPSGPDHGAKDEAAAAMAPAPKVEEPAAENVPSAESAEPPADDADIHETRPLPIGPSAADAAPAPDDAAAPEPAPGEPASEPAAEEPVKTKSSLPTWLLSYDAPPGSDTEPDKEKS